MRVLAALGGNALIRRAQRAEAEIQRENIAIAASSLAAIVRDHELVVTHGNGPQVGLLAGGRTVIAALDAAAEALMGSAGTVVQRAE
jgi:carbamate kinase